MPRKPQRAKEAGPRIAATERAHALMLLVTLANSTDMIGGKPLLDKDAPRWVKRAVVKYKIDVAQDNGRSRRRPG
jgi:hypothetical protein